MRHIDEIQIAGTAILLCGAMFAVSAVAPTGNTVSKAVTNFTEAPETAAEAQAQAEAQAEEDGFTIYTEESNYDSDYGNSYNDTSYVYRNVGGRASCEEGCDTTVLQAAQNQRIRILACADESNDRVDHQCNKEHGSHQYTDQTAIA